MLPWLFALFVLFCLPLPEEEPPEELPGRFCDELDCDGLACDGFDRDGFGFLVVVGLGCGEDGAVGELLGFGDGVVVGCAEASSPAAVLRACTAEASDSCLSETSDCVCWALSSAAVQVSRS